MECRTIQANVNLKKIPKKDLDLINKFISYSSEKIKTLEDDEKETIEMIKPTILHILNIRESKIQQAKEKFLESYKPPIPWYKRLLHRSFEMIKEEGDSVFKVMLEHSSKDWAVECRRLQKFGNTSYFDYDDYLQIQVSDNPTRYVNLSKYDGIGWDSIAGGDELESGINKLFKIDSSMNNLKCLLKSSAQIVKLNKTPHVTDATMNFDEYTNILNRITKILEEA